jgi:hypothetical protein
MAESQDREQTMIEFFRRIGGIGGVMQAVAGDKLQAVVEFLPSGRRVLLDLTRNPVQVEVGGQGLDGTTGMAGSVDDLHDAFVGDLSVIEGIGQRKLMAKGGMCHLVSFFPVLGMTPVLYAEHLATANARPGALGRMLAGFFGFFFGLFAWLGGLLMRSLGRKELIVALDSMSRGSGRFSRQANLTKLPKARLRKSDHPLDVPRPSAVRRAWLWMLSTNLYLSGWFISLLRYKLKIPLDLFGILGKMSRGLRPTSAGA